MTESLLREGVALLREWCRPEALARLHELALTLQYPAFTHSIAMSELPDEAVMAPLEKLADEPLLEGARWLREHSWLRKRYAPGQAPREYQPNSWHQDGALGVQFPESPDAEMLSLRPLVTLWMPLHDCGDETPTLEFVRVAQSRMWHYSELTDATLRERFAASDFWVPPELKRGDALLFVGGTLHRTHVREGMTADRFSVEYRFEII